MTTPKSILLGLSFIAIAIASIPYSNNVITPAFAASNEVHKIALCNESGSRCVDMIQRTIGKFKGFNMLYTISK